MKGIPDDLYARLKQTTAVHRRRLDNEAISVPEMVLLPQKATASERIARARALRAPLERSAFSVTDIDALERPGRR